MKCKKICYSSPVLCEMMNFRPRITNEKLGHQDINPDKSDRKQTETGIKYCPKISLGHGSAQAIYELIQNCPNPV